jgi:HD-like signal output (HDOD) protein
MDQMLKSKNLSAYDRISQQTWENSVQVAAIARVLARHLGRIHPDEAMLAGLVHNIGVFYLMYRAAEYPEYRDNEAAMLELLAGWHEGVGESLLHILGLPDSITDAVRDQNQLRSIETPCSISDVLHFAKLLADTQPAWQTANLDAQQTAALAAERSRYADLLQEAEEDILELRAALSA